MRFQVEVRRDHEDPLRRMASAEHRSVREHASHLLNLKIQEELARLKISEAKPASEAVA
jgi:hypothetical protein